MNEEIDKLAEVKHGTDFKIIYNALRQCELEQSLDIFRPVVFD